MLIRECSVVVLALGLSGAKGSTCQPTQPTCVFDAGSLLTLEQLKTCLDTLSVHPRQMKEYIRQSTSFYNRTLFEHYAFADINNDSHNSNATLSEAYNVLGWGDIYNVTTPWQQALNTLATTNDTNIFDFQSELMQHTHRHLDNHLVLVSPTPFYLIQPYILGHRVTATGATEFYIKHINNFNTYLRSCGHDGALSPLATGSTIAQVNGKPALRYFTDIASERVSLKHPGARLNQLIINNLQIQAIAVPEFRVNPVKAMAQSIIFSDGSTAVVHPVVYVFVDTYGSEALLASMVKPVSDYESRLVNYYTVDEGEATGNMTTRIDFQSGTQKVKVNIHNPQLNIHIADNTPTVTHHVYSDGIHSRDGRSPNELRSSATRDPHTEDRRRQSGFSSRSSVPADNLIEQLPMGDIFSYDNAVIVRYPSFYHGDGQTPQEAVLESIALLRRATELGEQLRKTRIVFDLTNNLGGHEYIASYWAAALTYAYIGKNDTRVCFALDLRMGPLVTAWADLTVEAPQNVTSVSDDELITFALSVRKFIEFARVVDSEFHDRLTSSLRDAITDHGAVVGIARDGGLDINAIGKSTTEQRAQTINTFRILLYRAYVDAYGQVMAQDEFYGFDRDLSFDGYAQRWGSDSVWTGVQPIAVERGTYKVDYGNSTSPSLHNQTLLNLTSYYFTSMQKDILRGGVRGNYTERVMHPKCTAAVQNFAAAQDWPEHVFQDVRFLSNGMCGSSCAMFVNAVTAIASGAVPNVPPGLKVTTITYGGTGQQPMTGTQFAGGNVENTSGWYRRLFNARALLDPLYLHIGPDKDENAQKYRTISELTPLPVSAGVFMTFTHHEGYEIPAGQHSLPTEFYDRPSDVNLNLSIPTIDYSTEAYLSSAEYGAIYQAASADEL